MSNHSCATSPDINRRVVIQLNEIKDGKHHKYMANMRSFTKPADIAEIEVIDNHRLKCNFSHMPGYEMFFDCIGLKNEKCINTEFTRLVSELLVNGSNANFLRFSCIRELDLLFLHKLFIHELDNYLKPLDNNLQKIYFEYHDLKKYDIVNMMANSNSPFAAPNQRKQQNGKKKMVAGREFVSTRDLFTWLNKDFVFIWSRGSGHDLFELDIHYNDVQNFRSHKVKFTLVQVYLGKLELNMKANLHSFLQCCNQKKKKHFSTLITDLLQEYFRNEDEQLLILFDIPVFRGGVTIVKDMLKLAEDTYLGIRYGLLHNTDAINVTNEISAFPAFLKRNTQSQIANPMAIATAKNKIQLGSPSTTTNVQMKNSLRTQVNDELTLQDLNILSYWYCKIEEYFTNVIKAMERFYTQAYQMKSLKMRTEIEDLFHGHGAKSTSEILSAKEKRKVILDYFNEYQVAIKDFRQLFQDINNSRFASNLEVFLRTKNYELLRQFSRFKEIQMENCHANLIGTISELVDTFKFSKINLHGSEIFGDSEASVEELDQSTSQNVANNSINNADKSIVTNTTTSN